MELSGESKGPSVSKEDSWVQESERRQLRSLDCDELGRSLATLQ